MFEPSSIEKIKTKKIYALEGNIGAGKTTILKIIGKHFKDAEIVEEPVSEWQNLGGMNLLDSFYSDPKRWGFSFEFYSMLTKIQALLKAANSDKPIIIIERSILSNKAFMDISKELGKLDKMEYLMLMNTYHFYIQYVYPQLSGIIYLDTLRKKSIVFSNYTSAIYSNSFKNIFKYSLESPFFFIFLISILFCPIGNSPNIISANSSFK